MKNPKHQVVVAIYPTSRGMGYCVFDTPRTLLDWGRSQYLLCPTTATLNKLGVLIDLYQPEVIVLEDTSADTSRRRDRIKKRITKITEYALSKQVPVRHISPGEMKQAFPVANKDVRAKDIVQVLPELESYLPPKRRAWDSIHPRMQIFDAVSLALTFFYLDT